MIDNGLRELFQEAAIVVTDDDVEIALTRSRYAGRSAVRRRRWATFLAPTAAALATAAVVTAFVVGGPATHPPKPAPATTVPPVPAPNTHAWFRHIDGSGATSSGAVVHVSGVWVIRLTTATRGTIDIQPRDGFGQNTLTYDAATKLWSVRVLQRYCGSAAATYRIDNSGFALTFTAVSDSCGLRSDVLDGTVFQPLTSPDQLIG